MEGKRVAPPQHDPNRGSFGKALAITFAIFAVLAIGAVGGMGVYANHIYEGVFPGVTMSGIELEGKSAASAYTVLDEKLSARLTGTAVTVTAGGESLGAYDLATLGARADAKAAADAAYAVGRESGALGWLKNALTMVRSITGLKTELSPTVSYDEDALSSVVEEMADRFDTAPTSASYDLSPAGLYATKEINGRELDRAALTSALRESSGGSVEATWTPVPARTLDLQAMADELSAEALPARYDVTLGKVVDGQVGVAIDVEAAQYVLDAAAEGERVQLPAEVVYPEMTAADLKAVLFRDLLSTAKTKVSGTASRKGNVKLSGECVNGTVLNSGDIFDYNQVVGKRTAERGFGYANAYINGETVDVIGGGICQTSTTVYYATLLANLEIVERYAHRYVPSYIQKGMDATVSWGGPEFRFRNNTPYPIRIEVIYEKSTITVNLYGTKTDDTYVKMTHEVLSTTPYETVYEETMDLPYGTQQQKQSGYTGYKVKSYRNIYDGNDNLISSTLEDTSNYKMRNEIILVGINGKPAGTTGGTGDSTGGTGSSEPSLPEDNEPEAPPIIAPEDEMPEWLRP